MDTALIEIRDVTVRRESTIILNDVSVVVPRKRHTAILGPNGSGKSSLLKLLTRDFYPSVGEDHSQGTVEILGETQWEVGQLRRRMGIVSPGLDDEFSRGRTGRMNLVDAVASGFTATRLREFGPKLDSQMRDRVDEAIATVRMESLRDRRVSTYSTGERRRAMIARAIVHRPDIFVLDEPTNGLDMTARASFLEILDQITQLESMTMVLVTHHIDEIPPRVGHVVMLDGGQITFDGAKDQGLTSERVSALFGTRVRVSTHDDGWFESRVVRTA